MALPSSASPSPRSCAVCTSLTHTPGTYPHKCGTCGRHKNSCLCDGNEKSKSYRAEGDDQVKRCRHCGNSGHSAATCDARQGKTSLEFKKERQRKYDQKKRHSQKVRRHTQPQSPITTSSPRSLHYCCSTFLFSSLGCPLPSSSCCSLSGALSRSLTGSLTTGEYIHTYKHSLSLSHTTYT